MQRKIALAIIAASASLVAGCASSSKSFPTLEIRDAERVSGTFAGNGGLDPQRLPTPLSATTLAQLPDLEQQARTAHSAFLKEVPAVRQAANAGAGAAIASDNWARAQVALADLDSLRSHTAIILGDLDLAFVDATLAFEDREAIGKLRDMVTADVREEDRILAELRARLSR